MSFWISAFWLCLASFCALIGCSLLALSQNRHWRAVVGGKPPAQTASAARGRGWILVFITLLFCVLRDGESFAAVLWPLLLAAAAFLVSMALAYSPGLLKPIGNALSLDSHGDT